MAGVTARELRNVVKVATASGMKAEIVKPDGTVIRLVPVDHRPEEKRVDDPRRRHL